MPPVPEPEHQGHLLQENRRADGIPVSKIMRELGYNLTKQLVDLEDRHVITAEVVARYTAACRTNYDPARAKKGRSKAARDQMWTSSEDFRLTLAARSGKPQVAHWWAVREVDGRHGPYCYLCRTHIARTQAFYIVDDTDRWAIMAHRDLHRAQLAADQIPGPIQETV